MKKITSQDSTNPQGQGNHPPSHGQAPAHSHYRRVSLEDVEPDGAQSVGSANLLGTDVWGTPDPNHPWTNVAHLEAIPPIVSHVAETALQKAFTALHAMIDSEGLENLSDFEAILHDNQVPDLYTMTENEAQIRGHSFYNEHLFFRAIRMHKYGYAKAIYCHCPEPSKEQMLSLFSLGGFNFLTVLLWSANTAQQYEETFNLLTLIEDIPDNALDSTLKGNCFLHFMDYSKPSCEDIFNTVFTKCKNPQKLSKLSIQPNEENNTALFYAINRGNEPILILFFYHLFITAAFNNPSQKLLAMMERVKSESTLEKIVEDENVKHELDGILASIANSDDEKQLFQINEILARIDDVQISDSSGGMLLLQGVHFDT